MKSRKQMRGNARRRLRALEHHVSKTLREIARDWEDEDQYVVGCCDEADLEGATQIRAINTAMDDSVQLEASEVEHAD